MTGEYNGWSNYPTWRVWNDIFSSIEFTEKVTEDELLEIAYDVVLSNYEMQNGSHLVEDYATVFISLASYYEISEAINEDLQIKHEQQQII